MKKSVQDFTQYICGKRITILGAGISNTPLVKLFLSHGCQSVCVRDRKEIDESVRSLFEKEGAQILCGADYLNNIEADLVIRTPGLRPDFPQLNELRKKGVRVVGETQLFLQFAPCKVFGITGSDGKTTTTTLIAKLLQSTGKKVYLGGNIGTPLLPMIDQINEDDLACLELSSFQLMDGEYSPDVSVITNVSENHLDWHTDMEEYVQAKKNIFAHQSNKGILIVNADDERTFALAKEAKGEVRFFSLAQPQKNGAYLENGKLLVSQNDSPVLFFERKDIRIPGIYNVANYLAALCAVSPLVTAENATVLARSFNGVEHRVEWIRTHNGVDYYNSSIDSSPSRTIATLGAFDQKLTVICGGYDKNLDYSVLKDPFFRHVKEVYLTGQTANKIYNALKDDNAPYRIYRCDGIDSALHQAASQAKAGDKIILSPASASFDSFKNFEQRGHYFKQLVNEL